MVSSARLRRRLDSLYTCVGKGEGGRGKGGREEKRGEERRGERIGKIFDRVAFHIFISLSSCSSIEDSLPRID